VLVELGVVEQRYRAVLEVLEEGAPVTAVARRYGVSRQTVHEWLRRHPDEGLGGLRTGRHGRGVGQRVQHRPAVPVLRRPVERERTPRSGLIQRANG
jgi:transposase-like protein